MSDSIIRELGDRITARAEAMVDVFAQEQGITLNDLDWMKVQTGIGMGAAAAVEVLKEVGVIPA